MPKHRGRRIVIGGPHPPKGAIPLPNGGYEVSPIPGVTQRSHRHAVSIGAVVRGQPDLKRFVQALLDTAKRMYDEDQDKAA